MIVGQALSGKSTLLNTCRTAIINLKEKYSQEGEANKDSDDYFKIECSTFNPKAITIEELYGYYDSLAQEWKDGLASKLLRECTI